LQLMRILDIDETADFLAIKNRQDQNHVGYIGTDSHQIKDTLSNDFSDLPLEVSSSGYSFIQEGGL
jgi:hypothetical protein